MISLLVLMGEVEVRMVYYRNKEEDMRKEENCNSSLL